MNFIKLLVMIFIIGSCGNANSKIEQSTPGTSEVPHKFEWDFSKKKKFIYSFSQTISGYSQIGLSDDKVISAMEGNGILNVRVKEGDLADLSLQDVEISMVSYDDQGNPSDTTAHQTPTAVVQDMKPNGSFPDSNSDILFDIIFPLPSKDLTINQSEKIQMKMPFNANGSRLFAKGFNELTFEGYETFEKRECAKLKGVLNISKLDIPEELKGEYKCSTTGSANYYFDTKNQYYVGADINITMDMKMDERPGQQDNSKMYMEMKNENLYKIRLIKIDE